MALAAPALQAQVINFHNAYNFANYDNDNTSPLYGSIVYSGQGAYSDPGHDIWNGFGGGFPPYPDSGFSSYNNGYTTAAGHYSDDTLSSITLTVNYGFDNGGLYNTHNTYQGTPAFILGEQAGVDITRLGIGTSNPEGQFTLHNVVAGTYDLYLYGANFDANRGAVFSLDPANGGTADNGIDGTINNGDNSTFVEGANYVIFNGVTPDINGDITGFWTPNPNSTLTGEGNFNGLQLVTISVSGAFHVRPAGIGHGGSALPPTPQQEVIFVFIQGGFQNESRLVASKHRETCGFYLSYPKAFTKGSSFSSQGSRYFW